MEVTDNRLMTPWTILLKAIGRVVQMGVGEEIKYDHGQ